MDIKSLAGNLGLTPDEFIELMDIYLTKAKSDMDELGRAFNTGFAEAVGKTAHSVKGASLNMGFDEPAQIALMIEQKGRKGDLDGVGDLINKLLIEIKKVESTYNSSKS